MCCERKERKNLDPTTFVRSHRIVLLQSHVRMEVGNRWIPCRRRWSGRCGSRWDKLPGIPPVGHVSMTRAVGWWRRRRDRLKLLRRRRSRWPVQVGAPTDGRGRCRLPLLLLLLVLLLLAEVPGGGDGRRRRREADVRCLITRMVINDVLEDPKVVRRGLDVRLGWSILPGVHRHGTTTPRGWSSQIGHRRTPWNRRPR